jgi:uncharacterized protein YjiK
MTNRGVIFFLRIVQLGCAPRQEFKSPDGYDLTAPEKTLMKESLLEISGIAFRDHRADTVFSINDEEGRLYVLTLGSKDMKHIRFARDGDYEDVAIDRHRVHILRSDGTLFTMSWDSVMADEIVSSSSHKLLPKGEYEGLCLNEVEHNLYVLCKNCSHGKDKLSGYVIDAHTDSLVLSGTFNIVVDTKQNGKKSLQPSALAINPVTREWFILSSVHKTLWVTDSLRNVKGSYALDPKIFIQPEGIAFDKDQNLYISNEGNEIHNGTILKFSYRSN